MIYRVKLAFMIISLSFISINARSGINWDKPKVLPISTIADIAKDSGLPYKFTIGNSKSDKGSRYAVTKIKGSEIKLTIIPFDEDKSVRYLDITLSVNKRDGKKNGEHIIELYVKRLKIFMTIFYSDILGTNIPTKILNDIDNGKRFKVTLLKANECKYGSIEIKFYEEEETFKYESTMYISRYLGWSN